MFLSISISGLWRGSKSRRLSKLTQQRMVTCLCVVCNVVYLSSMRYLQLGIALLTVPLQAHAVLGHFEPTHSYTSGIGSLHTSSYEGPVLCKWIMLH